MSLFIREILPSTMISDASLIPNFILESEQDVLAIARGNILYIYQIGNIQDSSPILYEFNNPIILIRPIYNEVSTNSNILIVFANYRACILAPNGESILNFSLINSEDLSNQVNLKCALHPFLVAFQISPHHIDIYSKTDNCLLKYATSISIGCKSIIDFCFIGPTTKVMQLAVLIEEFNEPPRLQIIDINSSDWTYREDPQKHVKLSKDSYLLFPIHPEQLSTVVVLNSNQCLRITQKNDGLKKTSATICTAYKIINCDYLHGDFFSYVDEAGNFGFVEISKKGTVHFERIDNSDNPFKIISLTHNLMFVASHDNISKVFKLKKDNSAKMIRAFQITGKINKVVKNNNDHVAICDRGSIKISSFEKVSIYEKINFVGGLKIFSQNNSIVVSKIGQSIELGPKGTKIDDSKFNVQEKTIFLNENIYCTETQLTICDQYKINDRFLFCEATQNFILYVNESNIIHLYSLSIKYLTETEKEIYESNGRDTKVSFYEIVFPTKNAKFIKLDKKKAEDEEIDEKIIGISMNDFYLAILTSYITIYEIPNLKIVKTIYCPDAISMKLYGPDQLIVINALDYISIYSIDSYGERKIYCKGSHTSICECNGFHVICGSNPSILIKNSIINIDCDPFYDAAFLKENEFVALNFGGIQKVHLLEKVFKSECSLSSIPISSFVRLNDDQYVYSRTMKDTTYFFLNEEKDHFYSCQNFVCAEKAKNSLNIICKNNVIIFDTNLKENNAMKFDQEILNFIVNHSKRYIYQKRTIIDLETKNPIFNALEDQSISYVSMNHKYTVFLINDDTLVLFVVNDDNSYKLSDMIPVFEKVTCLSLNADIVLIGTQSSRIIIMRIAEDSKFERYNSINLLFAYPTSIDKHGNSFYLGLSNGSILEIKYTNVDERFENLARILQNKMKCIAGLTKENQYLSEEIRYDNPKGIVFDISNISKFISMKEYEQNQILEDNFPLDEAKELLLNYSNLFLS